MERSETAGGAVSLRQRWHAAISAASADALDCLGLSRLSAASVHRVRVQCKRLRAYLALCHPLAAAPALARARSELRWTARQLAELRDRAALRGVLRQLAKACDDATDRDALAVLWRSLGHPGAVQPSFVARARMRGAFELAEHALLTTLQRGDALALVEQGLARSRRRCRRRLARAAARNSAARWHALRKRAKTLLLQLDATREADWRRSPARRRLHRLTTVLGERNDLELLRLRLRDDSSTLSVARRERVAALIERRQQRPTRRALALASQCRQDCFECPSRAEPASER
jgi:CHAD domain-containing protein